jgi:hemerythrin-like metal-binding protein
MAIKWHDFNSVNVKVLDRHHEQMASILDRLSDAKSTDNTAKIIDKLLAYTAFHFSAEEELFETHKYPDKDTHIKQHRYFLAKIKKFQNQYKDHKLLAPKLLDFLSKWWIDHVNRSDHKYSTYLNKRGVF